MPEAFGAPKTWKHPHPSSLALFTHPAPAHAPVLDFLMNSNIWDLLYFIVIVYSPHCYELNWILLFFHTNSIPSTPLWSNLVYVAVDATNNFQ